mmetsp:Transcript_2662/g.6964  ORF Transcript_2662/g.6964 Transcript_2662/m.6964 type:complete len:719 (-) Transcript_2662:255-2411(-)
MSPSRSLAVALTALACLGGLSLGLQTAREEPDSPYPSSLSIRSTLDEEEAPTYQERLDHLNAMLKERINRGRVRRGLTALTPEEDRRERRMRAREKRREHRKRERAHRRRLAEEEEEKVWTGTWTGDTEDVDFPPPGRRLQASEPVADAFLISGFSPSFNDLFCAAVPSDGVDVELNPRPKENLVLTNWYTILDILQPCFDNPADFGFPANRPTECFQNALTSFWSIDIIGSFDEDGPNSYTAGLSRLNNFYFNWNMEAKKYRRNKKVRINKRNTYNMLQTFDFRSKLDSIFTSDDQRPITRYTDGTWRPSRLADPTGNAIPGRELCFIPDISNKTYGFIQEGDNVKLAKCQYEAQGGNALGRQRSLGMGGFTARKKETWLFCGELTNCNDEGDRPDFTVKVGCEETSADVEECSFSRFNQDLNDGEAVEEVLARRFSDECDGESNFNFGKSLVYEVTDFDNGDEEGLDIELDYDCSNGDDADVILRVFEKTSQSNWDCVYIGSTDCNNNENEIADVEIKNNDGKDFLVVVSSDGTDQSDNKDLKDFNLMVACADNGDTTEDNPNIESNDNTYCFEEERLSVKSNGLTTALRNDLEECGDDDLTESGTKRISTVVDTRGIEFDDNNAITIELDCSSDNDDDLVEMLISVYKKRPDEDDDEYECVESKTLVCDGRSSTAKLVLDRDDLDSDDESGDFIYLIVGSEGQDNDCSVNDFECR